MPKVHNAVSVFEGTPSGGCARKGGTWLFQTLNRILFYYSYPRPCQAHDDHPTRSRLEILSFHWSLHCTPLRFAFMLMDRSYMYTQDWITNAAVRDDSVAQESLMVSLRDPITGGSDQSPNQDDVDTLHWLQNPRVIRTIPLSE